jgi:hypothetical protein
MKKILLSLLFFPFCSLLTAQDIEKGAALKMVRSNSMAIGLSENDLQNVIVSNAYVSNPSGIQLVYLQQSYKGLPVFNQLQVLAFKDGRLASKSGGRIGGIEKKNNNASAAPAVSAQNAVRAAINAKKIAVSDPLIATPTDKINKLDFGKAGIAYENITAELMWVPLEDGKQVRLAWQVYLVPLKSSDYFLIRVDAVTSAIIGETNLTVYCNWNAPANRKNTGGAFQPADKNIFTGDHTKGAAGSNGPATVNSAAYRVVPFPAESPIHPGGTPALVTDPWNAAPGNASTLKWHSNGTTDFNITRGNNVWAQEDLNANNGTGQPATSTTAADPLSFNFAPDFLASPTQTSPAPNQQFNITNLFYWNNIVHDVTYQYGFDEAAGNFQANNLGRGGAGNDFVFADAQDGNFAGANQNNANFSTPADGGNGRMQMYLWDSVGGFLVNTPATVAGSYLMTESNFSLNNKLTNVGPVTAQVVYYNDASASTHEACAGAPSNSVAGKIALINRGNCNFTIKVKSAQDAGAVGVIMVNNAPNPLIIMSGDDNSITIPAVMISDVDGALLAAQLGNNLNVTLSVRVNLDGDADNGVMVHEYTHGISNRLTGGPAQSSCVANAEQMGEGWSDYYSLMLTQDWATANVNTGFNSPRGMGTYVIGQVSTGAGIRTHKYSTNFAVNNLVFSANLPAEQHDRGEIWCATLWDMTWNIIQQVNNINPNIYNPAGGGGNTIALKLVTEGMKLQPCGPGFLDGRDAILQADQLLYGGTYSCAIKEAFRRRGMGPLAIQGSANSVTDQVPDFSAALSVKLTQDITQAAEGQNIVYTNTVATCSPVTNYLLTDTLPANVTYVSGGTYTAATRVVSFPVSLTAGQTQTYSFTVSVNTGSYFPTVTLLNEPFTAATMPATVTQTSTTATVWNVTNAQSHSAAYSALSPNTAVVSDQILKTASGLALGATPSQLSFWHLYNTEAGYDGGVTEISTDNGNTWTDLGNKMNLNGYNGTIDGATGTPIAGKPAFTGLSNNFIKTSVNLSAYTNQTALFRWRFNSDNGTAGIGWYVDDINVKSEPLVFMRTSLFTNTGVRTAYSDTVTVITQTAVCNNIVVTTAPANTAACTGSNATFSVTVTGTTPTYQWQVSTDGGTTYTNIASATAATLTLSSVTTGMNNNRYRVIVSNTCPSSVTTAGAILTVTDPANITAQPANVTVCTPSNATFSVTATGTSLTYQWQVSTDGGVTYTNIAGATATSLTLTGVTAAMNNNKYRVVVSSCSPAGLNSNAATLTVNSTAAITTQPANTSACTGTNTTITVTATGTAVTYQWQVSTDGGVTYTNIAGATSVSLTLTAVTSGMNNNRYRVIINNTCPSTVTSAAATLTVTDPASITGQPAGATVCAGNNATFSVTAAGSSITYQWQVSTDGGITFTNITGATATILSLTSVTTAMNNNQYRVVVFSCSPAGLNSNAATLTVNSLPAITAQPANTAACTGNNATFSVTATGTTLVYQWQVSTDGGTTYTNIAAATNASFTLTAVTVGMNNNRYRVIVSGACAPATTSTGAILTVSNSAAITTQPVNTAACTGNTATFTATASGVSYQWQVSTDGGTTFTDIGGATTTTLNLAAVTASMNNNQYRLVVFSCTPTGLNSTAATLTVNNSAAVGTHPANTAVCAGASASFTVTATGTALTYQWQASTDGGVTYTNITGATTATLSLPAVTSAMNNNRYRVIVNNACPSTVTSNGATLTVNAASVINNQPANATGCAGSAASFSVNATGASLTYQWEVSTNGGTSYSAVTGATGTSLSLATISAGMNNNLYRVVISGCGTLTSAAATLTVHAAPAVVITASPYTSLYADLTTTLTATSTPAATAYSWFRDGNLVPASTGNSIVVTYSGRGGYTASVTDANGCTGTSNLLTISDSTLYTNFIFPNPNRGIFKVRYIDGSTSALKRTITIFDSKGARVYRKTFDIASSSESMEVNIQRLGAGVYMVELSDANGKRLAKGKSMYFN